MVSTRVPARLERNIVIDFYKFGQLDERFSRQSAKLLVVKTQAGLTPALPSNTK